MIFSQMHINEDLKNLEVAFGWHGARSWRKHFFNLNPLKLGPNGCFNARLGVHGGH